jgi:hypothetical protein
VVGKWIQLAQTSALGSYPYVLEDRPEIHKVSGPHAEEGSEILERMYAEVCTSLRDAKFSGMAGGQVSGAEVRSGPGGIVSKDPWIVPA